MRPNTSVRKASREKRKLRVRAAIHGTPERPRLCVFRSNKHVYGQVIDDKAGRTLVAASSLSPEVRKQPDKKKPREVAAAVGELLAARAREKGIEKVVFDRNGFLFRKNGAIAMLADGARKGGLKF